ncbi:putative xenobiotic-transporting ATPase [Rosa chinensis]|uniref:Putative xenobiotic-transporting ATPase n=1 Tax=Rosa chinensis TaxID=74649 RepID=A0A2P6Q6Z6_ROSCH|nr:putative xenobiotic-transporting ATPase [Rosa chinensis]
MALPHVRGEIEFQDIYFSYPSRPDSQLLQGLNLNISAGKSVEGEILLDGHAIKRLQLKWLRSQMDLVNQEPILLAIFIRESILFVGEVEGEILLDGHAIKRLQLKWLRSQMDLVNQEPILFAIFIRESILFVLLVMYFDMHNLFL